MFYDLTLSECKPEWHRWNWKNWFSCNKWSLHAIPLQNPKHAKYSFLQHRSHLHTLPLLEECFELCPKFFLHWTQFTLWMQKSTLRIKHFRTFLNQWPLFHSIKYGGLVFLIETHFKFEFRSSNRREHNSRNVFSSGSDCWRGSWTWALFLQIALRIGPSALSALQSPPFTPQCIDGLQSLMQKLLGKEWTTRIPHGGSVATTRPNAEFRRDLKLWNN